MQKNKSCIYVHRVTSVVSHSLQPCILCPARLLCQGRGFSRQEYWSILAYTVCHTFLEHYISRCPSRQGTLLSTSYCQNPCHPSSCTTSAPGPHRGKPKSSRAASGVNPSGRPTRRGVIKPQLKPRGSVAKEEDPKPPTSCTSCRLNPHDQLGQICVYGIYKRSLRAPSKEY